MVCRKAAPVVAAQECATLELDDGDEEAPVWMWEAEGDGGGGRGIVVQG